MQNLSAIDTIYDPDSAYCPYCQKPFQNAKELEEAYSLLSAFLKEGLETNNEEIENIEKDVKLKTKEIFEIIKNKTQILDDESVKKLNEKIGELVTESDWLTFPENNQELQIEILLNNKVLPYSSLNFVELSKKYNFKDLYNQFSDIWKIEQPQLLEKAKIEIKITFIKNQYLLLQNHESLSKKQELKTLILAKKKLELVYKNLKELKSIYEKSKDEYKKRTLDKLRVPLLIYTGKRLQDYQGGLGVFIDESEMRFVANGDAKHDIINTFSSGQLSGFVLSFLFAMNKRYISKNELGFILVDDPVQTMDDINIASFIEVLRNDFKDKQIIISTHETDKENYILYKFLKYNLKGQSFNVKEKLYP